MVECIDQPSERLSVPAADTICDTTDASLLGWGAHISMDCIWGPWPAALIGTHINYLELLAIRWALGSFSSRLQRWTMQVFSDNTTAVAYVNHQGSTVSLSLSQLAINLWDFCIRNSIYPVAVHFPGILNATADTLSRGLSLFHKMELNWTNLNPVFAFWGTPTMDVFATRKNSKCNAICCWGGTDPRS